MIRVGIKCCAGCVPPKRHSGCHSTCPDYKKDKAQYEAQKERWYKTKRDECDVIDYQVRHNDKLRKSKRKKFQGGELNAVDKFS